MPMVITREATDSGFSRQPGCNVLQSLAGSPCEGLPCLIGFFVLFRTEEVAFENADSGDGQGVIFYGTLDRIWYGQITVTKCPV